MTRAQTKAAVEAVFRIQVDNCANMVADPKGDHPICKPRVGTRTCERCGNEIVRVGKLKACTAIPRAKRWRFKESPNNERVQPA